MPVKVEENNEIINVSSTSYAKLFVPPDCVILKPFISDQKIAKIMVCFQLEDLTLFRAARPAD